MLKHCPNQVVTDKKARKPSGTAGFTIVEVAVAAAVLVFALCSCFGVMQMSFKSLDTARTSTLAAQVMQSEIERLRLLNWADLSSLVTTEPASIDVANIYSGESNMVKRFTATRLISPTPGRETSMLDIQVTVTWRTLNGVNLTRTFKTKYSKNGLYDYFYTARPAS